MHSILIPHRDRNAHLKLCLWSIERSAKACGVSDYEIVVVDNLSEVPPVWISRARLISDSRPGDTLDVPYRADGKDKVVHFANVFNKSRCLNLAMEHARGDVLTFLDADAIVGRRFMEGVRCLVDPTITRLCYRVRYLRAEDVWFRCPPKPPWSMCLRAIKAAFAEYDAEDATRGNIDTRWGKPPKQWKYLLAYEAYRHHDLDRFEPGGQVWGNSQFSITRDNLGDLRWDESYAGKGFEDVRFLLDVEAKFGDQYRGVIDYTPERNMFHLEHGYDRNWGDTRIGHWHCRRYREAKQQMRQSCSSLP